MIPVGAVKILNGRRHNRQRSRELTTSIVNLGLKRPITVAETSDAGSFELACGEGRLNSFLALGQTEIPAVVTDGSSEDCVLMGLVENFARRRHTPLELVQDIGRLAKTYRTAEIAAKLDLSAEYVKAICYLLKHGEERLLSAVDRGVVPPTLAVEIAKAKTPRLQGALLERYVSDRYTTSQITMMRRLVEQRARKASKKGACDETVDPALLVRVYRREMDRQRGVARAAELTQARLLFVVNALKTLFGERMFVTLARKAGLDKMPLPIWRRMSSLEVRHDGETSCSGVRA
jgi:ParB family transcriptional regulator, chromosome partitioning protein